jgi:hypothetical protein
MGSDHIPVETPEIKMEEILEDDQTLESMGGLVPAGSASSGHPGSHHQRRRHDADDPQDDEDSEFQSSSPSHKSTFLNVPGLSIVREARKIIGPDLSY